MNELSTVQQLNTLSVEINTIREHARKIFLSSIIEIGRRLSDAKGICNHGEWSQWLEDSVDYSERTAQQYIKIYDEYTADQVNFIGESNAQALAHLSYTQAVILLGIPKEEREEFVEKNDIDDISTRELQELVKENKKLKEDKSKSDEQIVDLEKAIDEDMERLSKSNDFVNELQAKLKIADENNDTKSKEEVEKLKSDLKKAKLDNKTLANILRLEKEKPIEVETVEVIPEELQEELVALKEKLTKEDSAIVVKFRIQMTNLQEDFDHMKDTLVEMHQIQGFSYFKANNAVNALLEVMGKSLNNIHD